MDRYYSIMESMVAQHGLLDEAAAVGRIEGVFHGAKTDWILPGTRDARARWHNLKYYTWVEQQGKRVEELDAQRDPVWWEAHQNRVKDIDAQLAAARTSSETDMRYVSP
jgi:hypothetical protein